MAYIWEGDPEFMRAIKKVLISEGKFNPKDPGGGSMWGINAKYHPALRDKIITQTLTREEAIDVYYKEYWTTTSAHKFEWPYNYIFLDTAVNQGQGAAEKLYKQSGGDWNKFVALRKARYKATAADPMWQTGNGKLLDPAKTEKEWQRRADKQQALLNNATSPSAVASTSTSSNRSATSTTFPGQIIVADNSGTLGITARVIPKTGVAQPVRLPGVIVEGTASQPIPTTTSVTAIQAVQSLRATMKIPPSGAGLPGAITLADNSIAQPVRLPEIGVTATRTIGDTFAFIAGTDLQTGHISTNEPIKTALSEELPIIPCPAVG